MGILNALQAGSSNSASVTNAANQAQSTSWSNTAGNAASANSAEQAAQAHNRQLELLRETQEFNAREAAKQREWQTQMANTVYTRSVKNMIEAGINPILAAQMGLSAASVGSGSSASVSTPSTFMGQSFAEQNSASKSSSEGWSHGWSSSESVSGLAEGLSQMGKFISDALGSLNTAFNVNVSLDQLSKTINDTLPDTEANNELAESAKESGNKISEYSANAIQGMIPKFMQPFMAKLWDKANTGVPNPYSKKFRGGGAGHKF